VLILPVVAKQCPEKNFVQKVVYLLIQLKPGAANAAIPGVEKRIS